MQQETDRGNRVLVSTARNQTKQNGGKRVIRECLKRGGGNPKGGHQTLKAKEELKKGTNQRNINVAEITKDLST